MAVILFVFQLAIGNIQTLPSNDFSGKSIGSLAGVSGGAAVVGALITIWLVPIITVDSYVPFFLMGTVLVPLAACARLCRAPCYGVALLFAHAANVIKLHVARCFCRYSTAVRR